MLTACTSLQSEFKDPTVSVIYVRALPPTGLAPRFEIGLHVTNPNRTALELKGISYSVDIEGKRIITGVARQLPVIEPFGEGELSLTATTDLINSISLINNLMRQPRDTFNYELTAVLDPGGIFKEIPIKKKGQLSLAPAGE